MRQSILANFEIIVKPVLPSPLALQGEGRVGVERLPINNRRDIPSHSPHPALPPQSRGEGGKGEFSFCQNRLAHPGEGRGK